MRDRKEMQAKAKRNRCSNVKKRWTNRWRKKIQSDRIRKTIKCTLEEKKKQNRDNFYYYK